MGDRAGIMIHVYPDGTPIRRGDAVTWLRPQYRSESKAVEAEVEKCDGFQVAVAISVGGKRVTRSARPEHLLRRKRLREAR